MSTLQAFLNENLVSDITDEVAISKRFKDKEGNLLKFKIRAQTTEEFADAQKYATGNYKRGKELTVDTTKLMSRTVIDCTVEPSFRDADSIKKTGCMSAEQYLNKVLTAGEIANLYNEISKISGFESMQDLVDEAKN